MAEDHSRPCPIQPEPVESQSVLLNVTNVQKNFGIDVILEGASFRVERRDKTALVGRNGTGKTTLLKIITGELTPDEGSVHLAKGAKIGYLRQEQVVESGATLREAAESALADSIEAKRRLEELEKILEEGPTDEDLEEYASLHEHLAETGAYSLENDITTVLKRMGFTEDEFDRPTTALSGGERTRLGIAQLLLQQPDLLILDEPTNHLDLQAAEWLEGWIRSYPGAVLCVSHDRIFLENTVQNVIDLRNRTTKTYTGGFKSYEKQRAEEDAWQAELASRQQDQIDKLDEFVRRFMNSQRTAQARGRQKLMNRLITQKVEGPSTDRGMSAGFREVSRSGDIVLEAKNLSFGYPDLTLGRGLNWTVRIGEKWGVIGENGAGKSTLIKTFLGSIEPLAGAVRLGSKVQVGFFDQNAVDLEADETPLGHIMSECTMEPPAARNLLGRFLLEGDDVFRPIGTLSGGEKNKLVLAELTHLTPNLLILDEPTNHLDMASRDALIKVLKEYKGTLVLISHDRSLLSAVAGSILDVRKSGPVLFPGGYDDYRESLKRKSAPPSSKPLPQSMKGVAWRTPPAAPTLSPRELSKEIGRLEKEAILKEEEVAKLESQVKEVEAKLANLGPNDDVARLSVLHSELQEQIGDGLDEWEALHEKVEELKAQQVG